MTTKELQFVIDTMMIEQLRLYDAIGEKYRQSHLYSIGKKALKILKTELKIKETQ